MSARPRPRAPEYPDYSEPLEGDDMTTWLPSEEPMDPGEVTTWITSGAELPDFERTEARGGPRTPIKDPKVFENTGKVHKPRGRRKKRRGSDPRPPSKPALKPRSASPRPAPPRATLPKPEPAPRRIPTPEPAPRRAARSPAPQAPRPPTPEPAPPRRNSRQPEIVEEPSVTIPRPSAAPPVPRASSPRSRQPAPPVPQPPTVPDHWTPPPVERSFEQSGDRATDIQPEYDYFPDTPDVPNTVVSEEEEQGIDEVPARGLPRDAPTVMRPDIVEPYHEPPPPEPKPVRAPPPRFQQMPVGEPTVALPPPSQRNRSHMDPRHRDPTPEPTPEKLPQSASYSPPPSNVDTANIAPQNVKSEVRAPRNRAVGKPPPPISQAARSGRSTPTPRSGEAHQTRAGRLPKNVELMAPSGGMQGHHIVYGVVGGIGAVLIAVAVFAGLVILALSG